MLYNEIRQTWYWVRWSVVILPVNETEIQYGNSITVNCAVSMGAVFSSVLDLFMQTLDIVKLKEKNKYRQPLWPMD